ncbi:MAG: hypothetical protein E7K68_07640, partial [Corynebacterium kroppenstedtii]|nr:hypothetical protein [Corynebacterium kroppenstedtii]
MAALSAGIVAMVAAWLNSGVVGAYGWSGPTPWLTGAVAAGWMFAVGVITMAVIGIRRGRSTSPREVNGSERGGSREAEQDDSVASRADEKPTTQRVESADGESAGEESDADDESNVGDKSDAENESAVSESDDDDGDNESGIEDSGEEDTADGKANGESNHDDAPEPEADDAKKTGDTTALASKAVQPETDSAESKHTESADNHTTESNNG